MVGSTSGPEPSLLVQGELGCPLPGKRAGLCCACGFAGSVSPQKAGKCVWAPVVTSGGHSLLFYLLYYRRGWVGAHPELCSPFLAVEEPRVSPGSDPALLCLAGHTSQPR